MRLSGRVGRALWGWPSAVAEAMYRAHKVPVVNSSAMSVEEIAAVIMQSRRLGNG